MPNVYDVSLYNRDLKQMFISTYDESTQKSLIFIFNKSASLEYSLGKDIYEFNRDDFNSLFMLFDSSSRASVASRFSIIGKYVDFTIEQGFLKTGINLVKNFTGEEYYKKYVSKVAERKKFLSKEQFEDLLDFCVNDQDRAVFALLYEGARGRQEEENSLEELINLRIEDCNFDNNEIVLTRNDNSTRVIKVSDTTMEILKFANAQEKFIRKNGEVEDWLKIRKNDKMNLYQNGCILKPTRKGDFGKVTKQIITQRITTIKKLYGNRFITVNNIWLSGMVECGKQIKIVKGRELDREDYKEICRRFGHDEVYWSKIKGRIEKYI
jgi:integrase